MSEVTTATPTTHGDPPAKATRAGRERPAYGLPEGFRVRLGTWTHQCSDGRTLYGGTGTIVRLRPEAVRYLDDEGVVVADGPTAATVARLLLDRGLAEPFWSSDTPLPALDDVTVVIPVKDRAAAVDRLLAELPNVDVVVVDDGSSDPAALREVCARHGARLVRHESSRGPSAARNAGLARVTTEFVAFVDSDVVLGEVDLAALRRHFSDPRVGLVAPRVLGLVETGGALHRYEAARSSLDLGAEPALVQPLARVSYVPSAMMLARREALGSGFDESMEVAEDVDLVWRVAHDWSVRYEPGVRVRHDHRTALGAWFGRKLLYGTGAADLAARHGRAVAPAVMTPWTAAVTVGLLAQRRWSPLLVAGATALAHRGLTRKLSFSDDPVGGATSLTWVGLKSSVAQAGSLVTRHYVPVTLALLPFSARARRAYAVATVVGGIVDHRRTRPDLDPVRHVVLHALDDLAYGLGLWRGAIGARSAGALLPLVRTGTTPRSRLAERLVSLARDGAARLPNSLVRQPNSSTDSPKPSSGSPDRWKAETTHED